jgi:membrane protein DedA with SNARE-associated domain
MMQTLSDFSYWLVALGAMLEGEVSLALAAVAAERGLMLIVWVVAAAAGGAFIGDQIAFLMLRWFGVRLFARYPGLAARTSRVRTVLARRAVPAIFITRFLWGLRTPAYAALASSGVSYPVFFAVNAVACAVWAGAVGSLAFAFSHSVATVIARAEAVGTVGLEVAAILAGAALVLMFARWLVTRRKAVRQG